LDLDNGVDRDSFVFELFRDIFGQISLLLTRGQRPVLDDSYIRRIDGID